jgi:hypothetical protein
MNPANLKRYAFRKQNIKLKQEAASDENYTINKITDALEAHGIIQDSINEYINDIFSYASYDEYENLNEFEIFKDYTEWLEK